MKRLALFVLPVLALSACNSTKVPTKPSGTKVSQSEFIAAAKDAKTSYENSIIKKMVISGEFSMEISKSDYSDDNCKFTASGSLTYERGEQGNLEVTSNNLKTSGKYPKIDPMLNYYVAVQSEEKKKEWVEAKFSSNSIIALSLEFVDMFSNAQDQFLLAMLGKTFSDENCNFYVNPFEIEINGGQGVGSREFVRYDNNGVLSSDYFEFSFSQGHYRDEDNNKHTIDFKYTRSQKFTMTIENR